MIRRAVCVLAAIVGILALGSVSASAHEETTTVVVLDVGEQAVTGTVEIPLAPLRAAVALPSVDAPNGDALLRDLVVAYLADHLTVTGADGQQWRVEFGASVRRASDGVDVPVTVTPPGGAVTAFTVTDDALLAAVANHEIRVLVSVNGGERKLVGVLDAAATSLRVDPDAVANVGFWTMVHHGFDHVRRGADHLLFLLVLLLPAPLVLGARRWQSGGSPWRTLGRVVHVVTAFTVGHSITLMASALGWVDVPSRPVEILIAISVGAGAVHAIRPLVGQREAIIAATFGLVHGMAFAGILADLGLKGRTAVSSLFGFNVGIELAQLAAVALVFPSLYAISRTAWYPKVRIGGAGVALVFAGAWVADRSSLFANPLQGVEDAAVAHPLPIVGALAVVAVALLALQRGRTQPADD